jgi:peptidoglycan/xylan/chitin deacetylase (PgdA/CDA1 family)
MSLRSQLGTVRSGIMHRFYRRTVSKISAEPIVSFTFDDFPRTAYRVGGAILEEFGARGTYYAAASLMNSSSELGEHFSPTDLCSLLGKGHELANHTFSHLSTRSVSTKEFAADTERGRHSLEKLTGQSVSNFSYPFGHVTLRTKKALGRAVASARGIHPGINGPDIDLNLLLANRVYGDIDQAPKLRALIHENIHRRGWLIFYTHDIRPEPSPYGCTPALFESVVSETEHSGSRILSVGTALTSLGRAHALAQKTEHVPSAQSLSN